MNERNATSAGETAGDALTAGMVGTFIAVLARPDAFFSTMPRNDGYARPLLFMVVAGGAAAVVRAVLALLGLAGSSLLMAIAGIVMTPILIAIFGFVGAAILFVIWKLMGSRESYETAYRCTAYSGAIMPFTQLLNAIPYLGIVLSVAWWTLILVVASTRVHHVRQKVAITGFGAIAVILALTGISARIAAERMQSSLASVSDTLKDSKIGTADPAQAAKALTHMLQSMGQTQKGSDQ